MSGGTGRLRWWEEEKQEQAAAAAARASLRPAPATATEATTPAAQSQTLNEADIPLPLAHHDIGEELEAEARRRAAAERQLVEKYGKTVPLLTNLEAEIVGPRLFTGVFTLVFLFSIAGDIYCYTHGNPAHKSLSHLALGWLALGLIGAIHGQQYWWLRKYGAPGLVLSPRGIEIRDGCKRPFLVTWEDVTEVREERRLRVPWLAIYSQGKLRARIVKYPGAIEAVLARIDAYRADVTAARPAAAPPAA